MSDANVNALVNDIQWAYAGQNRETVIKRRLEKYFSVRPKAELEAVV